ncbi:MAG: ABC transporter permease [Xanthobacteraceae bacterium]|nr:ABC transporter permease [Xanthobacteraceae bacterium]
MARLYRGGFDTLAWALYAFMLAPLICVVLVSFNADAVQSFPPRALSLTWYWHALNEPSFVSGAITSAALALCATLLATPAGVAAALALHRARWRGKAAIELLLLAPLVVPGLVIGIALLVTLAGMDVREVPLRLLIGHVLIVLPYVVRTTLASLARLDPALTEAAETLGASRLAAFWQVILPLIRPGVVAGMLFGFILSFDDVSVSLFLVDARTVTLPLAIMSYLQYNFDPSIAAISSMLIGLTVVVVLVVERRLGMKQLFTG